ncbi:MAG TPA: ABC-F family ATP-binding cassette domain-containing protein, partial [Afifellaceae bacterium]|nr:ABC-F family ATP-binding cassette domain-containing protein [Afifellaceae bacterium]
ISAHDAEARAARILNGLGFDNDAQKQPCSDFSGGWRMRVALAGLLFSQPDLLLLDEPTNYLDLEGALWLERFLARYPRTVIIISHDRDLLNQSVNTIVHLEDRKLTTWRGGYDSFERQYHEAQVLQGKARAKQQAQRKHMEAFVARFRAKASKARQAQSRLKALEKLQPIAEMNADSSLPLHFPDPEKPAVPPIVRMEEASVGYQPGKPVLDRLNLRIDNDDRIALLGANGNGKSTFAKLLVGELSEEDGIVTRSNKLKIGYFAQHQLDLLIPDQSAFEHVRPKMPQESEARVRARVAQMGLATHKMDTPAKDLSGGEKARLLMGLVAFERPHLLILDEPTNHLDIDSREMLIHALNGYSGAVILISHDRHLIEACVDRLWLVSRGTVSAYEGDLDEYRRLILKGSEAAGTGEASASSAGPAPIVNAREERKRAAERREKAAPVRRKVKECEELMDDLNQKIQAIDRRLSDTTIYQRDPEEAARLAQLRARRAEKLEKAEEIWLELSELSAKLDAAE